MDASELERMMSEARRRMGEAHAKAKPPPEKPGTAPKEDHREPASAGKPGPADKPPPETPPDGLLGSLFKDKDKTIILALMLLLADENGDSSLLFALMYLLMD